MKSHFHGYLKGYFEVPFVINPTNQIVGYCNVSLGWWALFFRCLGQKRGRVFLTEKSHFASNSFRQIRVTTGSPWAKYPNLVRRNEAAPVSIIKSIIVFWITSSLFRRHELFSKVGIQPPTCFLECLWNVLYYGGLDIRSSCSSHPHLIGS